MCIFSLFLTSVVRDHLLSFIFFFFGFFYPLKIDVTFKVTIRIWIDLLDFDLMIILKAASTYFRKIKR